MTFRACLASFFLSLALVHAARADEAAAVKKMESMDASALAAFQSGDAQKAKTQLLEAVVLGKENALETHAMMARVYLHLGAVQAEGLKDEEKARRYFGLALRIQPEAQLTGALATPAAMRALDSVRGGAKPGTATATAAAAEAKPEKSPADEAAAAATQARDRAAAMVLREKEREVQERALKAEQEREQLGKNLTAAQEREKKEREGKEKLQQEKQGLEKQLAEAQEREKKERQEKERLQKINQELDKQLIEARAKEKQERETRAKLEAAGKERQERETKERQARDKLAEGPDMPGSIPQPIFCPTQDEWTAGEDVYVHCAPQSQVKAKELAIYYRPSGAVHYNSLLMDRSKKGWYRAAIPGERVTGRMLQFYVEARDTKGGVAANNGKPTSPNVLMIRPRGTPSAAAPAESAAKLTSASSTTAPTKARSGRRKRR
jgi:hypothetical protein